MISLLVLAAANAVSYFFRSEEWGDLLGRFPQRRQALGFPIEIWVQGNTYGGYFVDYSALLVNGACGLLAGLVLGIVLVRHRATLEAKVTELERQLGTDQGNFQFSMRGLLLGTAVCAVAATLAKYVFQPRAEVLLAIYVLGPWVLVGIAFVPRRIRWQQRVMVLIPITITLIVVAVLVGARLASQVAIDQVLLGIFICWTPQTVVAAMAISIWVVCTPLERLRAGSYVKHGEAEDAEEGSHAEAQCPLRDRL